MADGSFRHDLYFRLVTFEIELPPLRQRRERHPRWPSISPELLAAENGWPRCTFSAEALAALEGRPWYGNVRELRNAVEHALVLARGGHDWRGALPAAHAAVDHAPTPVCEEAAGRAGAAMGPNCNCRARRRRPQIFYERLLAVVEPPLLETV